MKLSRIIYGKVPVERWEYAIFVLSAAGLMLDGPVGEVTGDIAFWLLLVLILVHCFRWVDQLLYRHYHKKASRGIDIRR